MKEINLLSKDDTKKLLDTIDSSCGILIPDEKERLGALTFHLYQFNNPEKSEQFGKESWAFQIRYGVHPVFSKKHLKIKTDQSQLNLLTRIICDNKEKIHHAIVEYCQSQMDTIIKMELEPEFNNRFPFIFKYDLKLCKSRNRNKRLLEAGWPSLCIAISWNDEYNEFQEFMYPLTIDSHSRKFNLDTGQILTAFQNYRDSVV